MAVIILLVFLLSSSFSKGTSNLKNVSTAIGEVFKKDCSVRYTTNCFMLDLSKMIDNVKSDIQYQLLPGVFLTSEQNNDTKQERPVKYLERLITSNSSILIGKYVFTKFTSFLNSLVLNIKMIHPNSTFNVRSFADEITNGVVCNSSCMSNEGRGKKKKDKNDYGEKVKAILWTAGTMAVVGGSALFAITGKAVALSLVAILLGIACLFKNGNNRDFGQYSSASLIDSSNNEALLDISGRSQIIVDKAATWDLNSSAKSGHPPSPYQDYSTYIIRRT